MLEAYFKYVMEKEYSDLDGRIYIFLDEVQHVAKWSETVKSYYDRSGPVKFVISGYLRLESRRAAPSRLQGRTCCTAS